MISFVLSNFEAILKDIGLYGVIRNIQYGLPYNAYYLFSISEMYNLKSRIFFTPIGELGFSLNDIFEVSLLSLGELPYKEIVPTMEELRWMKKHDSQVYKTYWEVMRPLCIIQEVKGIGIKVLAKSYGLITFLNI